MEQTITEKILARAAGQEKVSPGQIIEAQVDLVMIHDHQGPLTLLEFARLPVKKVWDPEKIVIVLDHRTPSQTPQAAKNHRALRDFARSQEIKYFYDIGEGICHDLLVENGHIVPGMVLVATDSHTITAGALGAFATGVGSSEMASIFARGKLWFRVPESVEIQLEGELPPGVYGKDVALYLLKTVKAGGLDYKALEFRGKGVKNLSLDSRLTLCNMALEMGAKNAIFEPDEITLDYLRNRTAKKFSVIKSDPGACYTCTIKIHLNTLEPLIAEPHSPDNVRPAQEIEKENIKVDQAVIGTCTGGRYEDLNVAAYILKGKKIAPGVRLLVVPATRSLWLKASKEGLLDIFIEAGAIVSYPCCGPCGAYGMGALAPGETCITTGSRNFIARLGSPEGKIYLANTATVAASALVGKIVDPRSYL
ncbi:3-isopropylmalate dehydratase, large subunit [Thermanaeromonas toyohensis ToBE]|uniref:3-isopropylmalate dehydratase large subunit n=1 Tax=Thermanaeromonas toyohensis ToBE TaxID=698762 RepID=A0A1W1VJY1_9FIRM|nr:3-isopropylmalate dehydratase large subunit [Thermanaeromonas toyohensis]SMB93626.1 3-isopropylmalate dehydratase, large subunit [Thermanaeromonas toyohensis ToBE]